MSAPVDPGGPANGVAPTLLTSAVEDTGEAKKEPTVPQADRQIHRQESIARTKILLREHFRKRSHIWQGFLLCTCLVLALLVVAGVNAGVVLAALVLIGAPAYAALKVYQRALTLEQKEAEADSGSEPRSATIAST